MNIKSALLIILPLIMSNTAFAEIKQALAFELPPNWEVEYNGEKNIEFYNLQNKAPGNSSLLMFSRYPMAGGKALAKETMKNLASGFVDTVKKEGKITLESEEYDILEINGAEFSGYYTKFKIATGIVQTMFIIVSGTEMWQGQFTGDEVNWKSALSILSNIKNNG